MTFFCAVLRPYPIMYSRVLDACFFFFYVVMNLLRERGFEIVSIVLFFLPYFIDQAKNVLSRILQGEIAETPFIKKKKKTKRKKKNEGNWGFYPFVIIATSIGCSRRHGIAS